MHRFALCVIAYNLIDISPAIYREEKFLYFSVKQLLTHCNGTTMTKMAPEIFRLNQKLHEFCVFSVHVIVIWAQVCTPSQSRNAVADRLCQSVCTQTLI